MKRLRPVGIAAAFAVAFTLSVEALRVFFPSYDEFVVQEKLEHFQSHQGVYDTVFLGSSRVHRHIDPALFDQIAADAGLQIRSFNLGTDGMFPPEDGYVLDQILANGTSLKQVFVEVSMFLPYLKEENVQAARSVYYHDWRRTRLVLLDTLANTKRLEWRKRAKHIKAWSESLEAAVRHLQLFAQRQSNLGRGGSLVRTWLRPEQERRRTSLLGPKGDGFQSIDTPKGMAPAALREYEKASAKRRGKPVPYRKFGRAGEENLRTMIHAIRKAGATPVLVISPSMTPGVAVPADAQGVLMLDFSDPVQWPDLYRKENRLDVGHLNTPGAALYTRLLADEWLKAQERDAGSSANRSTPSSLDEARSNP